MCGPHGACDPRDDPGPEPEIKPCVTPKHAEIAAMNVFKAVMSMNPGELLAQHGIAHRSDNTIEHLRACEAAVAKGYSICPGHSARLTAAKYHCQADEAGECRESCKYCGAPKGHIFRGCKLCHECISDHWTTRKEGDMP